VILNSTSSPLAPFGPLIAAVIVALLAGGRRELWALLAERPLGRIGARSLVGPMASP
jgi:hypothetical protein